MEPLIEFSVDKTNVTVGDIVLVKWNCDGEDNRAELTVNNGFKQSTETVEKVGSKRIRINRASNGKVHITLEVIIHGKTYHKNIEIYVNDGLNADDGKLHDKSEIIEAEDEQDEDVPWWRKAIFYVATLLITIPILPFVYKLIPNLNWNGWDRLLEFILLLCAVGAVLSIRWWIDLVAFVVMLTILTIGTIKGNGYGFKQLAQDYGVFMYERKSNVVKFDHKKEPNKTPKTDLNKISPINRIKAATDYGNPIVRNFALQQTTEEPFATIGERQHSEDIKKIVHAFAVFKTINNNWIYVHDPNGLEYNSKASETIQNRSNGKFTGDCDDHAVLMAACVQAVGAKARIVRSRKNGIGHAYPELFLGSQFNAKTADYLIDKLFPQYRNNRTFCYRIDDEGNYWLNLDYTEHYPGGHFLQDSIVTIINF